HNEPLPPNFSGTSNSDRFRFSSVSPPSSSAVASFAMTTKNNPNFVDSSSSSIFATTNQQLPQYDHHRSSPFNFLSLTSTADALTVNNSNNSSGGFFSTFSPRSDSTATAAQQRQSSYIYRRTGSDGDSPAPSDYDSYVQV
uniref:Uncharacterized protein n=1 Tax=Romanomermis culicivorax TaxID=13658 RepID=A0A915IVG5_ROMCU